MNIIKKIITHKEGRGWVEHCKCDRDYGTVPVECKCVCHEEDKKGGLSPEETIELNFRIKNGKMVEDKRLKEILENGGKWEYNEEDIEGTLGSNIGFIGGTPGQRGVEDKREEWAEAFDKEFPPSYFFRGSDRGPIREFIHSLLEERSKEVLETLEVWLWDNGITHKESAQALQRKLRELRERYL